MNIYTKGGDKGTTSLAEIQDSDCRQSPEQSLGLFLAL